MILEDLESALAEHAPAPQEVNSELPPLTIDGIPVSVDKMTQVSKGRGVRRRSKWLRCGRASHRLLVLSSVIHHQRKMQAGVWQWNSSNLGKENVGQKNAPSPGHGCGLLFLLAVFSFQLGPWVTFSWNWFGQETVRTLMNHNQMGQETCSLFWAELVLFPYKFWILPHWCHRGLPSPGNKNTLLGHCFPALP